MNRKKVIFFLGNGFSQGFGFPSMSKLWDICLTSEDDYYRSQIEEAKKRYPLNYFISHNIKDIELLLTIWKDYSEAYEMYTNKHKSGRGSYEDYVNNFCDWLHKYTLDGIKTTLFSAFLVWLKKIATKYEIIMITTNYDLMLEEIFRYCSLKYHHTGNKEGSFPLRKLHGSISWFSGKGAITDARRDIKYEPIFEDEAKKIFVYNIAYDCLKTPSMKPFHVQFASQVDEYNANTIPTLIPPIIGKKYEGLFFQAMNDISKDFEDVDNFIIIGYSFPDSDPIVRDKTIEECKRNQQSSQRIVCINDDRDVCNKVNKLFEKNIQIVHQQWNLEILKELLE